MDKIVEDMLRKHKETESKIYNGVSNEEGCKLLDLGLEIARITAKMKDVADNCRIEGVSAMEIVVYFSMGAGAEYQSSIDMKEKEESTKH